MAQLSMGPGPVSAPPFGTIPINPFAFAMPPPPPAPHHPIISQQQQFQSLADLVYLPHDPFWAHEKVGIFLLNEQFLVPCGRLGRFTVGSEDGDGRGGGLQE